MCSGVFDDRDERRLVEYIIMSSTSKWNIKIVVLVTNLVDYIHHLPVYRIKNKPEKSN